MKKKRLILGSSSKFRKSLLNTLNLDFTCFSPDIDESRLSNEKPKDMAIRLSFEKAKKFMIQKKMHMSLDQTHALSAKKEY